MATLSRFSSLLFRRTKPFLVHKHIKLSTTPVLSAAYWNKDWKPGPLPTTPEERAAAAKKYGLRPEDYNVLSDGTAGDYPDLPVIAQSRKDPFEDYDHPYERRNYGEPLTHDYEIMGEDLNDPNIYFGVYTYRQIVTRFLIFCTSVVLVYVLVDPYPYFTPQMPKQYPFNDLYLEKGGDPAKEPLIKHYTFVPATTE